MKLPTTASWVRSQARVPEAERSDGRQKMKSDRLQIMCAATRDRPKDWRACKAHAIRPNGTSAELKAAAIFVDFGDGRDLTIDLCERRTGEGIGISCIWTERAECGGDLVVRPGAANVIYVSPTESRKKRRSEPRPACYRRVRASA